jgi:hypothetical protein
MDQIKILKRAFNITVNYRVLWVFGILLALTAGGSSSGFSGRGGNNSSGRGPDFNWQNPFPQFPRPTPEMINTAIGVLIAFGCILSVLVVIAIIARYVSETALIRMVDRHENNGEKLTIREGFRLGWSRAAFNMFLLDLLISLAIVAVILVAVMIALIPLLAWSTKNMPLQVLGTVMTVGLVLLVVFIAILVALVLSLVLIFAHRTIALTNESIIESIRTSYHMIRNRLKDIIVMGLIMFGVGILWSIAMFPVLLALLLVAGVIAGLPALLVGGIASLFTQGTVPWIIAAIVGAPLFLIVFVIPIMFIRGLKQVFTSSVWTLTYREVLALAKTKEPDELPAPILP